MSVRNVLITGGVVAVVCVALVVSYKLTYRWLDRRASRRSDTAAPGRQTPRGQASPARDDAGLRRKLSGLEVLASLTLAGALLAAFSSEYWASDTWFGQWMSTSFGRGTLLSLVLAVLAGRLFVRRTRVAAKADGADAGAAGDGASVKRRSGCLKALIVIAVILAVLIAAAVVGGWWFLRSDTGKEFMDSAGEVKAIVEKATSAPGTEALRAQGCTGAMVMTVAQMLKVTSLLTEVPEKVEQAGQVVVSCNSPGVTVMDCGEIAAAYAGAVPDAPARLLVYSKDAGDERKCMGYYDRSGKRLGAVGSDFSLQPGG